MAERSAAKLTAYEKRQHHNVLTSWLYSYRYRHVLGVFERLEAVIGDRPIRVIDIGCGYAKLYQTLRARFRIEYVGIDIQGDRVKVARQRYGHNDDFTVINGSACEILARAAERSVDIIVALETLEHIPERDVVRLVERISKVQPRRFLCSVPVEIGPAIWCKNVGSFLAGYVRHKEYSSAETFWSGLYRLDKLPRHGTRHKGFDWRWLAQTIRHNLKIDRMLRVPWQALPAALSSNLFMVAEPWEPLEYREAMDSDWVARLLFSFHEEPEVLEPEELPWETSRTSSLSRIGPTSE